MTGLKEMLSEEKERMEQIKTIVDMRLENVPEGNLRISSSKGHAQMMRCLCDPKSGKKVEEYIRKEKRPLAAALAQKEYDSTIQRLVTKRLNQFNKIISDYENDEIEQIFSKRHPVRKAMITPVEKPMEQMAEEWNQRPYIGKEFQPYVTEIYSKKGERVRSKSEKILADLFNDLGLFYKYECPLVLNGFGTIYPDFTLLSLKLKKEFYWEHLGLMDNPEYAEKAIMKIDTYVKNGIFPGDRLILTYESKNYALNDSVVMGLINKYFI